MEIHTRKCTIVFPTDLTNRSCKSRISSRVKSPQDASARLRQHMQGGGKEKHHSPPSRGSEQLHGRASLSTRSSGRRGPRVGLGRRPALALPAWERSRGEAGRSPQWRWNRRAGGRWRSWALFGCASFLAHTLLEKRISHAWSIKWSFF